MISFQNPTQGQILSKFGGPRGKGELDKEDNNNNEGTMLMDVEIGKGNVMKWELLM